MDVRTELIIINEGTPNEAEIPRIDEDELDQYTKLGTAIAPQEKLCALKAQHKKENFIERVAGFAYKDEHGVTKKVQKALEKSDVDYDQKLVSVAFYEKKR